MFKRNHEMYNKQVIIPILKNARNKRSPALRTDAELSNARKEMIIEDNFKFKKQRLNVKKKNAMKFKNSSSEDC